MTGEQRHYRQMAKRESMRAVHPKGQYCCAATEYWNITPRRQYGSIRRRRRSHEMA